MNDTLFNKEAAQITKRIIQIKLRAQTTSAVDWNSENKMQKQAEKG
jgi:hypothetical protein